MGKDRFTAVAVVKATGSVLLAHEEVVDYDTACETVKRGNKNLGRLRPESGIEWHVAEVVLDPDPPSSAH